MNFPNVARREKLSGTPVIEVTIGADGKLVQSRIRRSSGHAEIDEAALRILKLAAPFDPFPSELSAKHDEVRIAYEWQFIGGAAQGGHRVLFGTKPTVANQHSMSDSGYLTNQLLIAMPSMGDPNFAQTVALVCEHSARGALGIDTQQTAAHAHGRDLRAAGDRAEAGAVARSAGVARRPDANRSRIRGASRLREVGFDARGLRCPACHHLARYIGRDGPRQGSQGGGDGLGVCRLGSRTIGRRDQGERVAQRAGGPGV